MAEPADEPRTGASSAAVAAVLGAAAALTIYVLSGGHAPLSTDLSSSSAALIWHAVIGGLVFAGGSILRSRLLQ